MRIAAVQCRDCPDDAVDASNLIAAHLNRAEEGGIDLTVFPESFLLGQSYDPETIRRRAAASALVLATLCQRVAACHSTLIVGMFEQVGENIFNTAVIIERGLIVGRFAKAHPNEPGVTAGSTFPTFLRSGVRYGINICNDANYPATAQRIAGQGARLILYPLNNMLSRATADCWREKSLTNLIDRARQTGCWVASSDVTGTTGERISYGCTAIVSPNGEIVARVPELQEGVAVYDLPTT